MSLTFHFHEEPKLTKMDIEEETKRKKGVLILSRPPSSPKVILCLKPSKDPTSFGLQEDIGCKLATLAKCHSTQRLYRSALDFRIVQVVLCNTDTQ